MKKYRLKDEVVVVLLFIMLTIATVIYTNHYTKKIEKIEKGEVVYVRHNPE